MTEKNDAPSAEQAFLATTSHEIRTPLNGILGTVSLLLETELDPAQKEYAEAIRASGSRLLDLLNNILDYARLDTAAPELEPEVFCVRDLAREVTELLSPRAHAAGLDLGVLCRPGVPARMKADAGKLRQILFNLVGNALKFTESGGVLVDMDYRNGKLIFNVRDTGPGIAAADQTRLFDAFRQTSADDARKDGGVGLGLAIVKRLSEAMGGSIALQSAPGDGTCFRAEAPADIIEDADTIRSDKLAGIHIAFAGLPPATSLSAWGALDEHEARVSLVHSADEARRAKPTLIIAAAELPERSLKALTAFAPVLVVVRPADRGLLSRFHKMGVTGWLVRPLRDSSLVERILLVSKGGKGGEEELAASADGRVLIADDNPVNALIARRAFESAGFSVTVASTGREAVDVAETIAPALVFMDLRMPIMDGYEAMKALREAGQTMPIIAISAEINPEIERRARKCGADGVAAKPLDAEALRRLATDWTARRQGAA